MVTDLEASSVLANDHHIVLEDDMQVECNH